MAISESELAERLPLEALRDFARRWKFLQLAVFGSAVRDDFTDESDVDLLYTRSEESPVVLLELDRAKEELGAVMHREVDLVSRPAIERSQNEYKRASILGGAVVIYEQAA